VFVAENHSEAILIFGDTREINNMVVTWKFKGGKVLPKSGADDNEMNFSALKMK
jgi:hypothetical protein